MESALKQRLVGAGVIIALGVIVIPMILDGAGERQLRQIPDAPQASKQLKSGFIIQNQQVINLPDEFASTVIDVQEKPVSNTDVAVQNKQKTTAAIKAVKLVAPKLAKQSSTTKLDSKKTVQAKNNAPAIKKIAKPIVSVSKQKTSTQLQSWVVQVGSFTDAKKALSLREDLRKKRYKAFVEQVSGRSGQLYRVKIGPVLSRGLAEDMSKKLQADGLKGFITRHP